MKKQKTQLFAKIFIITAIALAVFLALGYFNQADAARPARPRIEFNRPVTLEGLQDDIGEITCWISRVGVLLIIIFIVWSGVRMISSGSSPERFAKGGKAFEYALIGGLVILGTGVIISTIAYALGVRFVIPIICI